MNNSFLSIVVVYYNIPDQFRRTLYSLSPKYQRGIGADQYEIIVVDNGSSEPPDISEALSFGTNIEVLRIDNAHCSPSRAINMGLNASLGRHVGVFIDGARIASAGLLQSARRALNVSPRAFVGSRGRYLGYKYQRESMLEGYNQSVESRLLDSVDWRNNPARLFEISVFDESSEDNWTARIAESNSLFMSRSMWRELGGYSTEFVSPGGGYVNLDTWYRACALPEALPIVLLGEATFHQFHGGVATNGTDEGIQRMHDEYERIRGRRYSLPEQSLYFFGSLDRHLVGQIDCVLPPQNEVMLELEIAETCSTDISPDIEGLEAIKQKLIDLENSTTWRASEPLRRLVYWLSGNRPPSFSGWDLPEAEQVKAIERRIQDIFESRSWRMGRPFRKLSAALRGLEWTEPQPNTPSQK